MFIVILLKFNSVFMSSLNSPNSLIKLRIALLNSMSYVHIGNSFLIENGFFFLYNMFWLWIYLPQFLQDPSHIPPTQIHSLSCSFSLIRKLYFKTNELDCRHAVLVFHTGLFIVTLSGLSDFLLWLCAWYEILTYLELCQFKSCIIGVWSSKVFGWTS